MAGTMRCDSFKNVGISIAGVPILRPSELTNKKMKMEDPNETSWVHIIPKTEICVKHCIAEFQTPAPGVIKEALSMFCMILRDFHAHFNQF